MKNAALVTGGAVRIGKTIALHLASLGYDIALHYNTSPEDAKRTASEIITQGVSCKIFRCDFSKEDQVKNLVKSVKKEFPHFNLLINSASIFKKSVLKNLDYALLDQHLTVNLKTPYILSCEFARLCAHGQIINILDTNITKNKTAYTEYLLSKKALGELTKLSAVQFAPGIRVNAVCPGLILAPTSKDNDYLNRLAKNIPLKKRGNPLNVAHAIQFLTENDYITGQMIFVDGGEHLL